MNNSEVAAILNEIGDLLDIIGTSTFRVNAYRKAANIISAMPEDINDIHHSPAGLTSIKGVGKGLAERVGELLDTGKMTYYEELKGKLPGSLVELIHIQGVGPKKAKLFYDELGISNLNELEAALKEHRLRELPGLGAKTEDNIERGLELYRRQAGRLLLNQAVPAAEKIIAYLKKQSDLQAVSTAGSLRRWRETIGDIDILASTTKPAALAETFCSYPEVTAVLARGDTKCSVLLHSGLQIDLRLIKPSQFGAALQYFTGSKAHNIHLREDAKKQGLKVSEYGVFKDKSEKPLAARTEVEVYAALGLPYIEPELREDKGEIEAARQGRLPNLINLGDIKGDLHCHTEASDGQSTLAEMAAYARRLGYHYLGLSDHARTLKVAHGLEVERFEQQWRAIEKLNKKWDDFTILTGVELNINSRGEVDFPAEVLARFDVVSASIHTGFNQDKSQITYRVLAAMENPHIDIICHPTGRILGRRPPYEIDLESIFQGAAATGTFLELNAFPDRLDLSDDHLRAAKKMGAKFTISTDSHHFGHLENMRYGVHTARRGWLSAADVINTLALPELLKLLRRRGKKS